MRGNAIKMRTIYAEIEGVFSILQSAFFVIFDINMININNTKIASYVILSQSGSLRGG